MGNQQLFLRKTSFSSIISLHNNHLGIEPCIMDTSEEMVGAG